jgi:phytoene/squalene synthetase
MMTGFLDQKETADTFRASWAYTRRYARSFYFASHVLPRQKRMASYALYLKLAYPQSMIATVPSVSARENVDSAVLEFTERAVRAMQAVPEGPAREQLEKLAASLAQRRP